MRKIKLKALTIILIIVGIQSCTSTKTMKDKNLIIRNYQIHKVLKNSIVFLGLQLDQGLKNLKKLATKNGNDERSLSKIKTCEKLLHKSLQIETNFDNFTLAINTEKRYSKFLHNKIGHSLQLFQVNLDKYSSFIQKNFSKYLTDTTSWSRRYIKRLPPDQQKNPPSFAEFYFKGASREEALVVLSTLQLGILQEALEIQEKILKE